MATHQEALDPAVASDSNCCGCAPGREDAQPRHASATWTPTTRADRSSGEKPAASAKLVSSRRLPWLRFAALLVLLATGGVLAAWVGLPNTEELRAQIAGAGPLAPALFIALYALVSLLPVPKNVFAGLAGVLFGLALGVVVVVVAALVGAAAAFALSRVLGREVVERITGGRVAHVDALLHRRGMLAVIVVRLVPVLPFTAINYAAGLTSVRTRDYAIGTALGILPGTISFVALGAYGTSPGSWPFIVSAAALALLTAGGLFVARRYRQPARHAAISRPPRNR